MSKKMPVSMFFDGRITQGYEMIDHSYNPSEVEIYGLKSKVQSVVRLSAKININGIIANTKEFIPILPLNEKNEVIDVSVNPSKVEASLKISPDNRFKLLPVIPTFKGSLPQGFVLSNSLWQPDFVSVKIERPSKGRLNFLSTEPIDLNGITSNKEIEAKLDIPDNMIVLDNKSIKVKVFVKKEVKK